MPAAGIWLSPCPTVELFQHNAVVLRRLNPYHSSRSHLQEVVKNNALSTELLKTHGERGLILGSYLTRIQDTARIRDRVKIILYGERMKDDKF